MIAFISTSEHAYTHNAVVEVAGATRVAVTTYGEALSARAVTRATYIFTDMDRLSLAQLKNAASLYRRLSNAGLKVLNDPARAATRFGLLRRLYFSGINAFNAYRVEEGVRPKRWPVFLRAEGSHLGPATALIHSLDELRIKTDECIVKGLPLASLLIVEFSAEPIRPGLYRKFGSFRLGPSAFAHVCVDDDLWVAKEGKRGITPPELEQDELRIVRDNPYGADLAIAFDIAGLEYGRADFGLVAGKVQVYEINSNPEIVFANEHPSPVRQEAYRIFQRNYLDALSAIDTRDSGTVAIA